MPKHYLINRENEHTTNLDEYEFGDILIVCDDNTKADNKIHYKTSEIKLIGIRSDKKEKSIISLKTTPNGLNSVPLCISTQLTTLSQLNSYSKKFIELKKYFNIFKSVELDTEAHASLLNIFTSNRAINKTRKLFYFFVDPDEPNINVNKPLNGVFVWHENEKNLDVDNDSRFIQVTPDLDDAHIGEQLLYERDTEVIEFSKKFKDIYENKFETYLQELKEDTPLYATIVPKNPKNEPERNNNSEATVLFHFKNIEYSELDKGLAEFVVVKSFDHSEEYKFFKKICTQYGPYQSTYLWCVLYNIGRSTDTENMEYFLDLPSYFYKLLDE